MVQTHYRCIYIEYRIYSYIHYKTHSILYIACSSAHSRLGVNVTQEMLRLWSFNLIFYLKPDKRSNPIKEKIKSFVGHDCSVKEDVSISAVQ